MKRVLCSEIPRIGAPTEIPESEALHLTRVLRLGNGDLVEAMDGRGGSAIAKLKLRGKQAFLELSEKLEPSNIEFVQKQVVPVCLELAVLKGDAMSWAIEKAVELGILELTPILTAHTVVQLDRRGPEAFQEKWQKIADQALKQCGRLTRMTINPPISLEVLLATRQATRIWCDEGSKEQSPNLNDFLISTALPEKLHVLIGPEGGWSDVERQLLDTSAKSVSLGPLILRAETAALFASSLAVARFRSQ